MNELIHLPMLRDRRTQCHANATRCLMRGQGRRCSYWAWQSVKITRRIDRLILRACKSANYTNMGLVA